MVLLPGDEGQNFGSPCICFFRLSTATDTELQEMDEFFSFEKMPLFVPAAKVQEIDQYARERELARGDAVRDVDSTHKEDFAGEKAHIEHNA